MNKQTRRRRKVSCKLTAYSTVKLKAVWAAIHCIAILFKAIDWVISFLSAHD